MSVPASVVAPACAWLVDQVQQLAQPDTGFSLYVGYGQQIGPQADDQVFIASANATQAPFAITGSEGVGSMSENLAIHVTVSIARQNVEDGADMFNRVAALVGYVLLAVRSDPTFGKTLIWARPQSVDYPVSPEAMDAAGWFSMQTDLVIDCFAVS